MNSLVKAHRESFPDDARTDDELTLAYASKYGVDELKEYPDFAPDYWRIYHEAYPLKVKDYAKAAVGSGVQGFFGTLASVPESVAQVATAAGQIAGGGENLPAMEPPVPSSLGLRTLGNKLAPEIDPSLAENFWVGTVPQAIGSSVGFMAGGAGARLLGAGSKAAIAGLGAAAGAGQGYQDVVNKGGTPEQALQSFALNALAGTTEAIPLAGMLDRINKGSGGGFAKYLNTAIKEAGEETVQEAFQQAMGNAIASDIVKYDPDRGWTEGVGSNSAAGGVSGFLISMMSSALGHAVHAKPSSKAESKPEEKAPIEFTMPMQVAHLWENLDDADKDELLGIKFREVHGQATEADRARIREIQSGNGPDGRNAERSIFYKNIPSDVPPPVSAMQPTVAPVVVPVDVATGEAAAAVSPPTAAPTIVPTPVGLPEVIPTAPSPVPTAVATAPAAIIPPVVQGSTPNIQDQSPGATAGGFIPTGLYNAMGIETSPVDAFIAAAQARAAQVMPAVTLKEVIQNAPIPQALQEQGQGQVAPATPPVAQPQPVDIDQQVANDLAKAKLPDIPSLPADEFLAFTGHTEGTGAYQDLREIQTKDATLFSGAEQGFPNRKMGVFESSDGQHVIVATVGTNSNTGGKGRKRMVTGLPTARGLKNKFYRNSDYAAFVSPVDKTNTSKKRIKNGGYKLIAQIVLPRKIEPTHFVFSMADWKIIEDRLRQGISAQAGYAQKAEEAAGNLGAIDPETKEAVDVQGVSIQTSPMPIAPEVQSFSGIPEEASFAIWDELVGADPTKREVLEQVVKEQITDPELMGMVMDPYLDLVQQGDKFTQQEIALALKGAVEEIANAYESTVQDIASGRIDPQAAHEVFARRLGPRVQGSGSTEGAGSAVAGTAEVAPAPESARYTRGGSAWVSANPAQIAARLQDLIDTYQDQGYIVKAVNSVTGEYGATLGHVVTLGMIDAASPTANTLRILLHEGGHAVLMKEAQDIQTAAHKAIESFASEIETIPTESAMVQELVSAGMSPERAVSAAPTRVAEERLAEHLARQGLSAPAARGIAANIFRQLKDLLYRLAIALQKAWGRTPSPEMALAFVENRFRMFTSGQRPLNLLEFMVPPLPAARQVETYTPTNEVGWITERIGPNGEIVYGDVSDAPPAWETRYSRRPAKMGVPGERNPIIQNEKIALANEELAVQSEIANAAASLGKTAQWIRKSLGLTDAEGLKVAAQKAIDPTTGLPADADPALNPNQVIRDFNDPNNRIRLNSQALANVRATETRMNRRLDAARAWIKANEDRIKAAVDHLKSSVTNFTDVNGLANEVLHGVRVFWERAYRDLAGLTLRPGQLLQTLNALVGTQQVRANQAAYQAEIKANFKNSNFYAEMFTLLDNLVSDKVDFSKSAVEIRDFIANLNRPIYAKLLANDAASQTRLAVAIAYAKSHEWILSRMQLRGTQPAERQKIVDKLLDAFQNNPDLGVEINAIPRAATFEERAMAALRKEKRKVRLMQETMAEKKEIVAAGEIATKFYAQAADRFAGEIQAHTAVSFGDGMKHTVPVKQPDGSYKFIEKEIKTSKTRIITNPTEVNNDLTHKSEWLAHKERLGQLDGNYWQIKAERDEILNHGIFTPGVKETIYRQLGLYIASLADQINSFGTPSARTLAQMIRTYAPKKNFYRGEIERLGLEVERTRGEAMRVLDPAGQNLPSYLTNFYTPLVEYLSSRRDLMESASLSESQKMDAAFAGFWKLIKALPAADARRRVIAGKEDQFIRAMRRHIDAEEKANQWLVDHNIDQVIDPATGKIRQRYKLGLVTFPVHLSRNANALYSAMHPAEVDGGTSWEDIQKDKGDKWGNIGAIYDGKVKIKGPDGQVMPGPDAARAILRPYFANERVQRWFLQELAMLEPAAALPGMMSADRETRMDANPVLVHRAYRESNGDPLRFLELIYQFEGGGGESMGEYVQAGLDVMRRYYSELSNVYARQNQTIAGKSKNLANVVPGFMVHARTIEHWPAAWREYLSFDRHTMNRAIDKIAAQEAFGLDNAGLVKNWETLKSEVNYDVRKLDGAEQQVIQFLGGAGLSRKELDKQLIALPEIGSQAELDRLRKVKKNSKYVDGFVEDLWDYFHASANEIPDNAKFARRLLMFLTRRMLEQPGSALTTLADTFALFRTFGVSLPTIQQAAKTLLYRVPRDLTGSLTQAIAPGMALPVKSEARRKLIELGLRDPLTWQDIGTDWRSKANWLSKADVVLGAGVNQAGQSATAPVLRPLAPFTQLSLTMNQANLEGTLGIVEDYLRQAIDHYKDNGIPQDWTVALGLKGGTRATFDKMYSLLLGYGIDFNRLVQEGAELSAAGEYLISDKNIVKLAGMANSEVSLEPNIATMTSAAYNNTWAKNALPLLGWMVRQSIAVSRMGMKSDGTGNRWFQIPQNREDVERVSRALLALATMMAGGLSVGMLIDWYNEEILGRRRNLRQLSWNNPTSENIMAAIEQTSRIGSLGLLGDGINMALNVGTGQGDNRGFSVDQRVVAASTIMTMMRAVSAWVNQGTADYSGVVRPALMAAGGNGALQYLQLLHRAGLDLGLGEMESRALARTNASNWLRAIGRTLAMEVTTSRGGYSTPTPNTPNITAMQLAAYANDRPAFLEAYQAAIRQARADKKEDPEDYVKRAFESRHPLTSVFRSRPSVSDYQKILAALPDNGRRDVTEAVNLFNRYGSMIGLTPFVGKAPALNSSIARSMAFNPALSRPVWTQGLIQ